MQVHLSKSQIGLLVAGVIISGLTAFSAASRGRLVAFDSRGLLAEVGGSGYQKAGQVTFWKDGSTLTGDPSFT